MTFARGNKAIRDHIPNKKDLLLFRSIGKGQGYRYLGQFICNSWEYQIRPDLKASMRNAIVFHLVAPNAETMPTQAESAATLSMAQLRERAMAARTEATEASAKEARRLYYQRSAESGLMC